MVKQVQDAAVQGGKKNHGKAERATSEFSEEASNQQESSHLAGIARATSVEAQADKLSDKRLQLAQRQDLAKHIGTVHGNYHLQKVIGSLKRETVPRASSQNLGSIGIDRTAAEKPSTSITLVSSPARTGKTADRSRLVTGQSSARNLTMHLGRRQEHSAVQRQAAPPGTDTSKLDALIAQVGAECDAFGKYKQSPLDGKAMPGQDRDIQLAVSRWDGAPVESWMKGYAAGKMGPLHTKLLNEMISMSGVGWPDYETLFDVAYQNPNHRYTMELKAAKTVTEKVIAKIVPIVTISYANDFGWAWHRDYALAAAQISAGISVSKKKGKEKTSKGGTSVGPVSLDIKGTASAKPVPIRFCGGNDFTGIVTVAKTSAKGHLGPAGGALPGLTAVSFHNTPEGDVNFPFLSPLTGSISGAKTDAGIDISIGEGIGKAVGLGETVVTQPPELKEVVQLSKSYRLWQAVIGPFGTGQAVVSPEAAGYLDQMHKQVYDFKTQELDPIAQALRDQSVDPDKNFQLDFDVVGMASRSWSSARSNTARLKLNQQLSLRRADAVETEIHNRFADVHSVEKTGSGAHAVGPTPEGGGLPPILDDAQAQALYEAKKKEALAETDPETRRMMLKAVEANYGPNGDQQAARRVYVFCRWDGYMIMKTLVPVTPSTPSQP
jgi:hypothetical protein